MTLDLDVLARAIHEGMLHNGRGGVDDDLEKRACVQFGWDKSYCHVKAKGVAQVYEKLLSGERREEEQKTLFLELI